MSLKKGDRVKHPAKAEWGLGEVLADSDGEKARVFFVGAGEKTISLRHAVLDCIPKQEAAHPLFDNLRLPSHSGRKYRSLQESIKQFRERYPGGFYGNRFEKEERKYKDVAHQRAQEILGESELADLLAAGEAKEVCRQALKISNATNLIFPNEKMALKDGLESPAGQQAFARSLFDLLYGKEELKPRFEKYADMLGDIGAAKWTIATYFLFIVFPEEHVFLKPVVTQEAADISAYEINYRPELNWYTYSSVLEFAHYLKAQLTDLAPGADLAPRDMIDVQSFMWCIAPRKTSTGKGRKI